MTIDISKITQFLKETYDVDVVIKDTAEDGITIAELKQKQIVVNKDSRDDLGILFVIAHLFGHMVQFTNYEKYRHLVETVEKPKPLKLSDEFKEEFYQYELEGYKIGKGLIEAVYGNDFAEEINEKYHIYLETDFVLFWQYLTTGNQLSNAEFNKRLEENFESMHGLIKNPLPAIELPKTISPSHGANVY